MKKHGLWDHYKIERTSAAQSVGRARAQNLKFGRFQFDKPMVVLNDFHAGAQGENVIDFDGVIGVEFLRRFDMWTDSANRKLALQPNSLWNDVVRYDRSGLELDYVSGKEANFQVVSVVGGSPASKAGFKAGDTVMGFSGGGSLSSLRWALCGPPGGKVAIKVRRGGDESTLTVELAEPA